MNQFLSVIALIVISVVAIAELAAGLEFSCLFLLLVALKDLAILSLILSNNAKKSCGCS